MSKLISKHKSRRFPRIRRFLRAEEGVSALEYAILVGVISVGVVAAIVTLGDDIVGLLGQASTNVGAAKGDITP